MTLIGKERERERPGQTEAQRCIGFGKTRTDREQGGQKSEGRQTDTKGTKMRDESGEKKVKKPGGMENRKNHTWKPRKAKRSCEVRLLASSWQLELASSLPDVGHSWIHLQPLPQLSLRSLP